LTDRRDYKRVVRARARKTGESYSSALRNVRNARPDQSAATASEGSHQREPLVNITRTIPDVRSTNVDKTVRFYTELFGFDARTEDGRVVSFVSASHAGVEVTLNRDGFALPPGFTVEVETEGDVAELFDRAPAADIRVIEPLRDAQFSVLDPSGRRVTVAPAPAALPPAVGDVDRPIARAIPESVIGATAAKRFYVDYLGFRVRAEWPDIVMFKSRTSAAQVLAGASLTSPDAFDLDVGSAERVDSVHAAAVGNAVVMGGPVDFPDQGIRCFLLIDPNGVAINVSAPLDPDQRTHLVEGSLAD
jgi:catechol 2,3-dioxygenase-like lactoylglutathione lyase family enzyme